MLADYISREPSKDLPTQDEQDWEKCIALIFQVTFETCPISIADIKRETRKDKTLSTVIFYVVHGWPSYKDNPEDVKPYVHDKITYTVHDDCLFSSSKVVLPVSLRQRFLEEIHSSHVGAVRMKSLYVFWPKITQDIDLFVKKCDVCVQFSPVQPELLVQPNVWPSKPWSRLHIDLAGPFHQENLLVLVDHHSKWIDVKILKNTSALVIVNKLKKIFSYFGIPDTLISDNGTQFVSDEYQQF